MSEESNELKFQDITVKIETPSGKIIVPAVTHKACPDLCICMPVFGFFNLTHIAQGRKLSSMRERFGYAAVDYAQWAMISRKYGFDWSADDLGKQLAEISGEPVPFGGCTITTKGEQKPMTIGEWQRHNASGIHELVGDFPWEETNPLDDAEELLQRALSL